MIWSDRALPHNKLNKGCHLVIRALQLNQRLSSVQDLHIWLRENMPEEAPALTTIYRAIDTLQKSDLIQAVDFGDGERRYELVAPGEHHHHLICTQCRSSIHLDRCFLENLASRVEERHSFKVRSHILEIFGLCAKCKGTSA